MTRSAAFLALPLLFPTLAHAYGEATALGPSPEERALHFFTDQIRVEPDANDPAFSNLPPVRPLVLNEDLNEAARFYADDMAENGCFPPDHSSCDGTAFGERVGSFYNGLPIAENIAQGQPDAEFVVSNVNGWLYSDGHRGNMLSGQFNELGPGFALGAQPLWVQDFGFRGGIEEPILTSATHWPLAGSTDDELRFYTALYDPDGAPDEVKLVSVGACHELELDRGADGMSTWTTTAPTYEEGCMPYWFYVTTAGGETISYPTEGSLLAPIGGADCEVWTPNRSGADCAPSEVSGFQGSGGGCATTSEEYGPDANVGGDYEYGTCSLGARRPAPRSWLLVALLGLGLRRRRR